MEPRKITVVSTKDQTKKVIMSSATTLAELKADFSLNNIDYEGMTFFEGTSKVELRTDDSVLPHDVPYKGTITNELVFMLTNTNKKIKSGAMSRMEAYDAIKNMGLQDACFKKFGKNFTMCKTIDLIALINENKDSKPQEETTLTQDDEASTQHSDCVDTIARAAITRMVEILYENNLLEQKDRKEIFNILGESVNITSIKAENLPSLKSSYSDNEIDDMFENMNI